MSSTSSTVYLLDRDERDADVEEAGRAEEEAEELLESFLCVDVRKPRIYAYTATPYPYGSNQLKKNVYDTPSYEKMPYTVFSIRKNAYTVRAEVYIVYDLGGLMACIVVFDRPQPLMEGGRGLLDRLLHGIRCILQGHSKLVYKVSVT